MYVMYSHILKESLFSCLCGIMRAAVALGQPYLNAVHTLLLLRLLLRLLLLFLPLGQLRNRRLCVQQSVETEANLLKPHQQIFKLISG